MDGGVKPEGVIGAGKVVVDGLRDADDVNAVVLVEALGYA